MSDLVITLMTLFCTDLALLCRVYQVIRMFVVYVNCAVKKNPFSVIIGIKAITLMYSDLNCGIVMSLQHYTPIP